MTAAQLFAAATREVKDLHGGISRGDFSQLLAWLRDKVHGQGKFLSFDELMLGATGETLDAKHFKQHLTQRYQQRT